MKEDKNKKYLEYIILVLLIFVSYNVYRIEQRLDENVMITNQKIDELNIDTSGKINELTDTVEKIGQQKSTHTIEKEVKYIEKTDINDPDIELNSNPAKISVKVNDGKIYNFDLLPNEGSKFEKGKLVIDSMYSTSISLSAPEYKRSKLSVIGALNKDKDVIAGASYDFSKDVSAIFLVGQEIDPYVGLSFRVGRYK